MLIDVFPLGAVSGGVSQTDQQVGTVASFQPKMRALKWFSVRIRTDKPVDPTTTAEVVYTVAASTDAPAALTFGPAFMDLASTYDGTVVLGTPNQACV